MVKTGRVKNTAPNESQEEALPKWADDEIKSVQFEKPDVLTKTGYILDIYEKDFKIDIQVYEALPDGRTIVEGLDVPKVIKMTDFMKGFVYEFKIKIYRGPLSLKLVEFLKSKFGVHMYAIYRFEMQELQIMDVESDSPISQSAGIEVEDED